MADLSITNLSIIVPVLNEEENVSSFLSHLSALCVDKTTEIILVDGGSRDQTVKVALEFGSCQVVSSDKGRANQMNTGAKFAKGNILLFLHVDTQLSDFSFEQFLSSGKVWGRFDVKLSGRKFIFRIIENFMNFRSKHTGICTGDQAMFVTKVVFDDINGFASIPLMEDVEISARLRKITRPYCLLASATTSSRRWENKGVTRTILLMWRLRLFYFFGVSVEKLAKQYGSH